MEGASTRGRARWMVTRAAVLLGVLACHRTVSLEEPTAAPTRAWSPAAAATAASASAPAPTATLPPIDEAWVPPAGLREPAKDLVIDWERPPPQGVSAKGRRLAPSRFRWEFLVDRPLATPTPLDDVSRPCLRQHFLAYDTRPLRTVVLRYDAGGRVVRERVDEDTDGTIELEHEWTWGSDGLLERELHRTSAQPSCSGRIPESVTVTRHRYDAHGVWLGGQIAYDGRPQEKPSWRMTTYDGEERLTSYLVYPTHEPQRSTTFGWTEGDEMTERIEHVGSWPRRVERWHTASDGWRWHALWTSEGWVVDRTRYHASGQPLVMQRDDDDDGRVDAHSVWSYDEQSRVSSEERDTDGDGDVDERIESQHDAAGFLVSRVHTGPAGTRRETWEHGPDGKLRRWTSKVDGSWVEDVMENVYDAAGRELERHSVHHQAVRSAGDVTNYVSRSHWRGERDGQGRLLRAFVSAGELGPDERVEYSYDCKRPYRRYPRRDVFDRGQCTEF